MADGPLGYVTRGADPMEVLNSIKRGALGMLAGVERPKTRTVTNQQVIDVLADVLMLPKVRELVDVTKGAQSTTFRERLRRNGIPDSMIDLAFRINRGEVTKEAFEGEVDAALRGVPAEGLQRLALYSQATAPARMPNLGGDTGNLLSGAVKFGTATPKAQPPPDPNAPGAPGATQTPPPVPDAPRMSAADLRAQLEATYGWATALADIPQVSRVLDRYAAGEISLSEVGNLLRATDYYKTTTANERAWNAALQTDPADAATQAALRRNEVADMATKLGVQIDPNRLTHLAELSLRHGWDTAQIQRFLSHEIRFDPNGQKQQIFENIKGVAREYLVPLSDAAMTSWAQSIVAGTQTTDTFSQYLRDQAVSLFPSLKVALQDPNMTVRKYLDPYGQTAAKTLGINDADIDWTDAKWSRFINQVDPKTGQRTVMPLADMQRTLVADPTYGWSDTAQGQSAKTNVGLALAREFGFAV